MSSLVLAQAAWVAALSAAHTGVNVFAHGGKFDRKQLEEYSKKAPAVALALMRFDPVIAGGVVMAEAHWVCAVFTINSGQGRGDRHETCIALAEAVSKTILQTFGAQNASGAVSRGHDLVARNMFEFELDRQNVAMWGIEFAQTIDLVQEIDSAPFERMHLVWDLSPRDNAADLGDLPEAEDDIELDQG